MDPVKLLRRAAAIAVCLVAIQMSYSQTATLGYFEASAHPNEDSTASAITFVVAVNEPAAADSLSFNLTVAGESIYASANTVEAWKGTSPYRIQEGVLYLTISAGSFNGLGVYAAEAVLRSANGARFTYTRP